MTMEKPPVPEPTANYPAHRHEDMKRQVEENFNPGSAGEIAGEWESIGATFTQLAVDFQVIVSGSESGWTGSAGEGVRAALAKVGRFSDMTGDHFTATGTALHHQTTAASEAKTRMPDPIEYDPRKMFTDAIGSGSLFQLAALPVTMPLQKARSENAKAEAVQVMQVRDDTMRSATSSMPAFAELPTVTRDQGTATGSDKTTSSVTTHSVDPTSRTGSPETAGTRRGDSGGDDTGGTTHASWTAPSNVTPPAVTPPVAPPPPITTAPPIQPPWVTPPGARPPGGSQDVPPRRPVPPPGARPPGPRPGPPGSGTGRGGPGGLGGPGGRPGGPGGMPGGGVPGGAGGAGGRGGFGPLGAGGQSGFGPTGTPGPGGHGGPAGGRGAAGTRGAAGAGRGGEGQG
ncbi:hypothetical protein, partial [Saccharothrix lopnurensis]